MRVSGGYSAIGALTETCAARRTRRSAPRSNRGAGDTVSISDEAKAAFRAASGKIGDDRTGEGAETAAKFRQALEDAWKENGKEEGSLMGKLRSVIASRKTPL